MGESRELKVAAGDWLLLQANHGKDFINGERVQVRRRFRTAALRLADGRTLPAGFNTFTHGYAVTSHSSQGKTVDEVLLVASSKSFAAVNREQFYVSISRGRERVHVFTDDSDLLARRVTDSHERKAAVELQALRDDLAKLGFTRKRRDASRRQRWLSGMTFARCGPCVRWPPVAQDRPQRHPPVARSTARAGRRGCAPLARCLRTATMKQTETGPTTESRPKSRPKRFHPRQAETPQVRRNIKLNVPPPRRSRGIGI